MTEALEFPDKDSYLYVTFEYNDGDSVVKYTDWHEPEDDDFTYKKMEVTVGASVGTFEHKQTEIEFENDDAFSAFLSAGGPLPPIDITIVERSIHTSGDPNEFVLFKGRLAKVTKNPQGKVGTLLLVALPLKANLDHPLGLICTQQCVWNFGGKGCEIDGGLAPLQEEGTCTVILTDRSVTITGLPPAPRGNYWRQGYITRNGLSIIIREWDEDEPSRFLLRERPPAEWIGQIVTLTPGCDKSINNCRDWENEERFAGLGIAMPDYHPNIEG